MNFATAGLSLRASQLDESAFTQESRCISRCHRCAERAR
jgi:hypothetical protein